MGKRGGGAHMKGEEKNKNVKNKKTQLNCLTRSEQFSPAGRRRGGGKNGKIRMLKENEPFFGGFKKRPKLRPDLSKA